MKHLLLVLSLLVGVPDISRRTEAWRVVDTTSGAYTCALACDPITTSAARDTACIAAAVSFVEGSKTYRTVELPWGICRLTAEQAITSQWSFSLIGKGAGKPGGDQGGTIFVWEGASTTDPMFLCDDCRNTLFKDFSVIPDSTHDLNAAFKTVNGAGSAISPTANRWENIYIDATASGAVLNEGIWGATDGAGGAGNQENYVLDNVTVTGQQKNAVRIDGAQMKNWQLHNFACLTSNPGVSTSRCITSYGCFNMVGGGGGYSALDIDIESSGCPSTITNADFEGSKLFVKNLGSSGAFSPLTIIGTRWSAGGVSRSATGAARKVIVSGASAGGLTLIGNTIGDDGQNGYVMTANAGTNVVMLSGFADMAEDVPLYCTTTTTLPGGLALATTYYAKTVSTIAATTVVSTDIVHAVGHGLSAGRPLRFSSIVNTTNIDTTTTYYVLASGLTADDFKVATSPGGSVVDLTGSNGTLTATLLDSTTLAASVGGGAIDITDTGTGTHTCWVSNAKPLAIEIGAGVGVDLATQSVMLSNSIGSYLRGVELFPYWYPSTSGGNVVVGGGYENGFQGYNLPLPNPVRTAGSGATIAAGRAYIGESGLLVVGASGTAVTAITGGVDGDRLTIRATGSRTITDNAAIVLVNGVDYTMVSGDVLALLYTGSAWHEVGRSGATAEAIDVWASNTVHTPYWSSYESGSTFCNMDGIGNSLDCQVSSMSTTGDLAIDGAFTGANNIERVLHEGGNDAHPSTTGVLEDLDTYAMPGGTVAHNGDVLHTVTVWEEMGGTGTVENSLAGNVIFSNGSFQVGIWELHSWCRRTSSSAGVGYYRLIYPGGTYMPPTTGCGGTWSGSLNIVTRARANGAATDVYVRHVIVSLIPGP